MVLLVYVLSHLRATCANKAAGGSSSISLAVAAAAAAEERVLRRLQRVERRAIRRRLGNVCWRHAMQMLVRGNQLFPLGCRRVGVMPLEMFVQAVDSAAVLAAY